jgi:ribokinase
MAKKIVVVGSSNTDMIIKMARIPKPGETIIGGDFSTAAGGKGANQAVAAARAGGNVTFIARLGDDMFGQRARDGFIAENINVDHVIFDKESPSGVALIFVGEDGENSIGVASGANAKLSVADILTAKDAIKSADVLVMQLEIPMETVRIASAIASENGVKIILNPAPAQKLDDDILRRVSILTPNESEAELLTGIKIENEKDAGAAAGALIKKGVEAVLVTMGEKGVFAVAGDFSGAVAGFKVKVVDTTAAGDVFNGVLAVAMAEGKPLKEAVYFANAAAALSVTKLGAQPSAPKRKEIDKFLNNHHAR